MKRFIKRIFAQNPVPAPADEAESPESVAPPVEPPVPAPPAQELLPPPEENVLPHWLQNEDVLRDEGVIYGLSNTDPQGKINSIQALYKKHTATSVQTREELLEKIGELNLILEQKNSSLEELRRKADHILQSPPQPENTLRVATGLLLALGMCAGNYFLIREGVRFGYPNATEPIAWGVFLTGMFSLYYTTALVHSDDSLTWKRMLEEFGMPLAAALFVFVQVVPHLVWYQAGGFLLFTFFAFLLSGKLLLGSLARLRKELHVTQNNRQLKIDKVMARTDWQAAMEMLEKEMEKIRLEKWKIVSALNETEAYINRKNAEKEAAVSLFLSEYNLAQDYRGRLSGNQISKILPS